MKRSRAVLFVLLMVLIAGCAATPPAPTRTTPPTALEIAKLKSLDFMARYKAQFDDTASMGALAQAGKLSLGQVKVYRVKKELLTKVKPLIKAFDDLVAGGVVPPEGREQEINDIINRLVAAGGGA